jgi:hypothetical protein
MMISMTYRSSLIAIVLVAVLAATSACTTTTDQATATGPDPQPSSTTVPEASPPVSPSTSTPVTEPPTSPPTQQVQDAEVSQILSGYTSWSDPGFHSTDSRALTSDEWVEEVDDERQQVTCLPSPLPTVVQTIDEFPAFGFSGDNILPGLVVDGSAVTTGEIRVLPVKRAPFTLRSSLASANPTTRVEQPDSGTIAEAVASLKRDADPRLGGVDVTGGSVAYNSSETHSFEQSALSLGVSLRYRSPLVKAGLDTDYSQQRSVERHTITVQMVQRQFTLSMVDDSIAQPGHYFDAAVTPDQIRNLVNTGSISSAAPPMVIDQVSYGRLMYFTMSSTQVSSASELRAAVEAAKGKYEGGATIDATSQEVLSSATYEMVANGGDQTLALNAIKSGNLSDFFGPSNPTTATPLTFTFKTLDRRSVSITESAEVQRLGCTRTTLAAERFDFKIEISRVQGRLRVFVNGEEVADVKDDNPLIGKKRDGSATLSGGALNGKLTAGENEIKIRYTNAGCDDQFTMVVKSASPSQAQREVGRFSHPHEEKCWGGGDLGMSFVVDTTDGSMTTPAET